MINIPFSSQAVWALALGIVVGGFSGCGPSAPPTPDAEIQKNASAHDAMVKTLADKYKKGPKGGHSGK